MKITVKDPEDKYQPIEVRYYNGNKEVVFYQNDSLTGARHIFETTLSHARALHEALGEFLKDK